MHLHIDCRAGTSGDMFLSALSHLGLALAPLEEMFRKAGIGLTIEVRPENRHGLEGRAVDIRWPDEQPLRHLPEIIDIITSLDCSQKIKNFSEEAFRKLAEAEAHVHGCPVEKIHFHEVGAIDTLVDVVGAFWGLEVLGVTSVTSSPLPWFSGTVACEHGVIPLPAPATLELMKGLHVFPSDAREELVTPTGALILGSLIKHYGKGELSFSLPGGVMDQSGLGYGARPGGQALRLSLLKKTSFSANNDKVGVLESHLDHLTGEELAHALEALMEAGALDVLWLPGLMKKGRPGGALRVLCREEDKKKLALAFFRHTHTLGIRHSTMDRYTLERAGSEEALNGEKITVKSYTIDGVHFTRPEFESLKNLAEKTGETLPGLRFKPKNNR